MCQALALNAQVVAREVVDNQTTYRIQYERQIKTESGNKHCIYPEHFPLVHQPAEEQEDQPYQFRGQKVDSYVS